MDALKRSQTFAADNSCWEYFMCCEALSRPEMNVSLTLLGHTHTGKL